MYQFSAARANPISIPLEDSEVVLRGRRRIERGFCERGMVFWVGGGGIDDAEGG